MHRTLAFACLLVFVAAPSAPAADRQVQQPMGGIAGNHPYFYSGKTGQDYAQRVGSGFRELEFQRIRIIPNHAGHRVIIVSPRYYWHRYSYGYDRYRESPFGYTHSTPVVEPRPVHTTVRSVAQVQPRVPEEPWAMLAGGYYNEAVGSFAMKAQRNEPGANAGYAIACALKGDHGQAAWAMRQAVESGDFDAALKQTPPLRQRLRELAIGYESDASSLRWPSDRWFLASAFHYLRGDKIAARKAIEHLDDAAAQEAGAAPLRRLITGR